MTPPCAPFRRAVLRPRVLKRPDVVLHGHAHRGTFRGFIGDVPVYNVAIEVMKRDFFVFELGDEGLRPLEQRLESAAD